MPSQNIINGNAFVTFYPVVTRFSSLKVTCVVVVPDSPGCLVVPNGYKLSNNPAGVPEAAGAGGSSRRRGPRGGQRVEKGDGGGNLQPRWGLRWPAARWRRPAAEGARGGAGRGVRRRGEGGKEVGVKENGPNR